MSQKQQPKPQKYPEQAPESPVCRALGVIQLPVKPEALSPYPTYQIVYLTIKDGKIVSYEPCGPPVSRRFVSSSFKIRAIENLGDIL